MIKNKLYKIVFAFCVLLMSQCYKTPFFELNVRVIDQELNPVSNVSIKIEVTDISSGSPVNGSIINFESITNSEGISIFTFENKAFVTARACQNDGKMCKEGFVYLEENSTKELTLMLESGDCLFCDFQ